MNKICFGCGIKLQYDDKDLQGYIPKEKYNDSTYCQRCFRITHYGDNKELNTPKSTESIINNINKNAHYVLFLINFITIDEDILKIYNNIKIPKMLVISKSDVIPKSINFLKIISYFKNIYHIDDEIRIVSSNTGYGVNALINYLYYKNIKEVYLVGQTNSGKSSLINKMMDSTDCDLNRITVSKALNTTLDYLKLRLNDNLTIIDSPGFVLGDEIKPLDKLIKPKVFQMKKDEILKINEYYFKFSEDTNITIYLNKEIDSSKYYKKIDFKEEIKVLSNTDLVIKNEGFINIKKKTNIKLYNISTNKLEIRASIFGGIHE